VDWGLPLKMDAPPREERSGLKVKCAMSLGTRMDARRCFIADGYYSEDEGGLQREEEKEGWRVQARGVPWRSRNTNRE
jgi:hypothetical protein